MSPNPASAASSMPEPMPSKASATPTTPRVARRRARPRAAMGRPRGVRERSRTLAAHHFTVTVGGWTSASPSASSTTTFTLAEP